MHRNLKKKVFDIGLGLGTRTEWDRKISVLGPGLGPEIAFSISEKIYFHFKLHNKVRICVEKIIVRFYGRRFRIKRLI